MDRGEGSLLTALKRLLLPTRCVHCGRLRREPLCADCLATLSQVGEPCCIRCGRQRRTAWSSPDCAECHGLSIGVSRARSQYIYDQPGRELLAAYKFRKHVGAGEQLARRLAEWTEPGLPGLYGLPDLQLELVLPVPLHPKRQRKRRFNQAGLLAQLLATCHGLSYQPEVLKRERDTERQVGLTASQRWQNVRGAFGVAEEQRAALRGKQVLLVDDLMTTGATLAACAHTLRRAGAAEVLGLTLFSTVHELSSQVAEGEASVSAG